MDWILGVVGGEMVGTLAVGALDLPPWALAVIGGVVLIGTVAWVGRRGAPPALQRFRRDAPGQRATEQLRVPEQTPAAQLNAVLFTWLNQHREYSSLWSSFDQVIREALTEHLGATRVRCYRVQSGSETLKRLEQGRTGPPTNEPSARTGVLGHVATTGREFVAEDAAHGPLVDALAAESPEGWSWVWPVQDTERTLGVIAIGHLQDPAILTSTTRTTVGQALTLYWRHIDCLERLRINQRLDHASGVLTRNDFFALAEQALADSYAAHEPVVVVTLRLEGLRRLDDEGRWHERDQLIQRIGHAMGRRVRSDDLIGRFADDRFVVLLRRLDSGLGALIAEKLLDTAGDQITALADEGHAIKIRAGLAGSGLNRPDLEALLVGAFDAVERARLAKERLATDLPPGSNEAKSDARSGA